MDQLFVDWGSSFESCEIIKESTSNKSGLKFRGKFQEANRENKNRRVYTKPVLETNVERLMETVKANGLMGELDHPTDSIVHLANVSHIITNLWWENDILMGEGQVLDTPLGRVLRTLIEGGARIGISSRGVGSGRTNENGVLVISENYRLITFDAVADPSTHQAFQERIVNTQKENVNCFTKNESGSIYKINKDLLLACVGGIISSRTNEIKERL